MVWYGDSGGGDTTCKKIPKEFCRSNIKIQNFESVESINSIESIENIGNIGSIGSIVGITILQIWQF